MGILFNADEIFEMAERIEGDGARYYRKVAERAEDPGSRELLLELAGMEEEHEKIFTAMRKDLASRPSGEVAFDPEDKVVLYLRAFADSQFRDMKKDPSEQLTGDETMEEILRTAIMLEKDTIAFYIGIKELVPEKLGKDKLDAIIREEMDHITDLSNELKSLKK